MHSESTTKEAAPSNELAYPLFSTFNAGVFRPSEAHPASLTLKSSCLFFTVARLTFNRAAFFVVAVFPSHFIPPQSSLVYT
jgi:hypothetical protein